VWRWSKNVAVGLSLVLFLAAVVFWVRSYWVGEEVVRSQLRMINVAPNSVRTSEHHTFIRSSRGRLRISTFSGEGLQRGQLGSQMLKIYGDAGGQWLWGQYPPDWLDVPLKLDRRVQAWRFGYGSSHRQGMIYGTPDGPIGISIEGVVLAPWWALAAVFAIGPMWRASRIRRWWRRRRGLCANCGYDLRATGATCPECGMAVGIAHPQGRGRIGEGTMAS